MCNKEEERNMREALKRWHLNFQTCAWNCLELLLFAGFVFSNILHCGFFDMSKTNIDDFCVTLFIKC